MKFSPKSLTLSLFFLLCTLQVSTAQNTIPQSGMEGNESPIKITDFSGAASGIFSLDLNLFTNTYNTKAAMKLTVDLSRNTITVSEYSHFASDKTDDPVTGNGTSEIITQSEAYCKFKIFLSYNILYVQQLANPSGPNGKIRLNPSSWSMSNKVSGNFSNNGERVQITNFNGAQTGIFSLDLNFFTNTYNTRAHMTATVDLSRNLIEINSYSHFASDRSDDPVVGNGTSEVSTSSEAYCKFKVFLANNTLYLEQITNPGGPQAKLRLETSSWIKSNAVASDFVLSKVPVQITNFYGRANGIFSLDLNFLTNTYNTRAHMSATIDLNRNIILVNSYSHFASNNTNDPVIGNGTREVTTQSEAYSKFRLYLSNNTLYMEQLMNPGGPKGRLKLEPSSWSRNNEIFSDLVGIKIPVKATDFNGATNGTYAMDLNFFTTTYSTRAHMSATVDLNRRTIVVNDYRHFASDKNNDPITGNGTSEVATQSEAYCKFRLYLSNNTLYMEQVLNPSGPNAKLKLEPSTWRKL